MDPGTHVISNLTEICFSASQVLGFRACTSIQLPWWPVLTALPVEETSSPVEQPPWLETFLPH